MSTESELPLATAVAAVADTQTNASFNPFLTNLQTQNPDQTNLSQFPNLLFPNNSNIKSQIDSLGIHQHLFTGFPSHPPDSLVNSDPQSVFGSFREMLSKDRERKGLNSISCFEGKFPEFMTEPSFDGAAQKEQRFISDDLSSHKFNSFTGNNILQNTQFLNGSGRNQASFFCNRITSNFNNFNLMSYNQYLLNGGGDLFTSGIQTQIPQSYRINRQQQFEPESATAANENPNSTQQQQANQSSNETANEEALMFALNNELEHNNCIQQHQQSQQRQQQKQQQQAQSSILSTEAKGELQNFNFLQEAIIKPNQNNIKTAYNNDNLLPQLQQKKQQNQLDPFSLFSTAPGTSQSEIAKALNHSNFNPDYIQNLDSILASGNQMMACQFNTKEDADDELLNLLKTETEDGNNSVLNTSMVKKEELFSEEQNQDQAPKASSISERLLNSGMQPTSESGIPVNRRKKIAALTQSIATGNRMPSQSNCNNILEQQSENSQKTIPQKNEMTQKNEMIFQSFHPTNSQFSQSSLEDNNGIQRSNFSQLSSNQEMIQAQLQKITQDTVLSLNLPQIESQLMKDGQLQLVIKGTVNLMNSTPNTLQQLNQAGQQLTLLNNLTLQQKIVTFSKQQDVKVLVCNCSKTKCLKLYCMCFYSGQMCGSQCRCSGCFNNKEHESERDRTINEFKLRNPNAFKNKIENIQQTQTNNQTNFEQNEDSPNHPSSLQNMAHNRGCNCKKTLCKKKYCECYGAGVKCSSLCRCEGCQNGKTENVEVPEQQINLQGSNIVDQENYSKGNVVSIKTQNNYFGNIKLDVYKENMKEQNKRRNNSINNIDIFQSNPSINDSSCQWNSFLDNESDLRANKKIKIDNNINNPFNKQSNQDGQSQFNSFALFEEENKKVNNQQQQTNCINLQEQPMNIDFLNMLANQSNQPMQMASSLNSKTNQNELFSSPHNQPNSSSQNKELQFMEFSYEQNRPF